MGRHRAPRPVARQRSTDTDSAAHAPAALPGGRWVLVNVPGGGSFLVSLRTTDLVQIRAALDRNDSAGSVKRLVDGWRDLVHESGAVFYFSAANLERLASDPTVVEAILVGITAKIRGMREQLERVAQRANDELRQRR